MLMSLVNFIVYKRWVNKLFSVLSIQSLLLVFALLICCECFTLFYSTSAYFYLLHLSHLKFTFFPFNSLSAFLNTSTLHLGCRYTAQHKKWLIMVPSYFASRLVLFCMTLTGSCIHCTGNLGYVSTALFPKNKLKKETPALPLCPVVQALCTK